MKRILTTTAALLIVCLSASNAQAISMHKYRKQARRGLAQVTVVDTHVLPKHERLQFGYVMRCSSFDWSRMAQVPLSIEDLSGYYAEQYDGGIAGATWYDPIRIALDDDLFGHQGWSDASTTLAHEIGHAVDAAIIGPQDLRDDVEEITGHTWNPEEWPQLFYDAYASCDHAVHDSDTSQAIRSLFQ